MIKFTVTATYETLVDPADLGETDDAEAIKILLGQHPDMPREEAEDAALDLMYGVADVAVQMQAEIVE